MDICVAIDHKRRIFRSILYIPYASLLALLLSSPLTAKTQITAFLGHSSELEQEQQNPTKFKSRLYALELIKQKQADDTTFSFSYHYTPISWPIQNIANNGHLHRLSMGFAPRFQKMTDNTILLIEPGIAVSSNRLKHSKFSGSSFFLHTSFRHLVAIQPYQLIFGFFNNDSRGKNQLLPLLGIQQSTGDYQWEISTEQLFFNYKLATQNPSDSRPFIKAGLKRAGRRWDVLDKTLEIDSTVRYQSYYFFTQYFYPLEEGKTRESFLSYLFIEIGTHFEQNFQALTTDLTVKEFSTNSTLTMNTGITLSF